MVAAGLVTANEATWLGSMRNRKTAIGHAARMGGKPARKAVRNFAAQVVELAFVRDRIDRGFGDDRVYRDAERGGLRGARGTCGRPRVAGPRGVPHGARRC